MLKMKFLQWRITMALKNERRACVNAPYSQSKNMGVLFSVEDPRKKANVEEFINRLERDGKKVQTLEYFPIAKEGTDFTFDFFTEKDLNFLGKIKSDSALRFAKIQFDYLFCIDLDPNPLILYLLATCQAACRVGHFNELTSSFFEMMVTNESNNSLTDTMYQYIKQLR